MKLDLRKKIKISLTKPGIRLNLKRKLTKEEKDKKHNRVYLQNYYDVGYKILVGFNKPTKNDLENIFLLPTSLSVTEDESCWIVPCTKKVLPTNQLKKTGMKHGFVKIKKTRSKKFKLNIGKEDLQWDLIVLI